jgi:hypothetical protein
MNMPVHSFRLTSLTLALIAGVAGSASAAVSNVDPEQQRGPDDLVLKVGLLSKLVDQGVVRNDDATAQLHFTGRIGTFDTPGTRQGVGIHLDGFFAVGEDTNIIPSTAPGECIQVNAKVDYLYEVLDSQDIPMFEFIPHYEFITYPNVNETQNYLKFRQNWVGIDGWYMLPWEGIEVGGGADWNINDEARMFRGAVGAREFYQDAPFDLSAWQLVNFGNRVFKRYYAAGSTDKSGFTTVDVGGKITLPLPWEEVWTYLQAEAIYWVDGQDRKALRAAGVDSGDFIISVGVEYRPE